jgi:hypothetical protein
MEEFPKYMTERIGYYVYILSDPETREVFYVGKGNGNRMFAHVQQTIDNPLKSDKLGEYGKFTQED